MENISPKNKLLIRPELRGLLDAPKENKPRLFWEYCIKAIGDKKSGVISLEDAAYQIAGTMFIHELDEPLFEEITLLAGRLELPAHISKSDPTQDWQELVSLIKEYGSRFKKKDSRSN